MRRLSLACAFGVLSFAIMPPEIPDIPNVVLWTPNTATFPGQAGVIYYTLSLVGERMNAHGFYPDHPALIDHNSFEEFLSLFGPIRYGYYLFLTHGGDDLNPTWLMLEAYSDEATATQRVNDLRRLYPGEEAHIQRRIWINQEPPHETYHCVCVNSIFINNRSWQLPDAFLFTGSCHGASGSPSICDAFRSKGARTTIGYTVCPWVSEVPMSAFTIFYHMAGSSMNSNLYEPRNKTVAEAVAEYQKYWENNPGHPHRLDLLIEGNSQMKFYNSPRIVGLEVRQAGKLVYRYHFDDQSYYPYEWDYPGDLLGCPKDPAIIGNQPLEVQILFSSPMNPSSAKVAIMPEQGNFVVPVAGNFHRTIFDNDWFIGHGDISEWQGGEDAIVGVDAEDAFQGDKNAALDINGDGNSDVADRNHKFNVELPPQIVDTDPAEGGTNVTVDKRIKISFNKEMDQITVNSSTVQFSPSLVGGFTAIWSGDGKTVTLTLTNTEKDLEYITKYTVTVTDGVKDKEGVQLDGDKDGKPGGNFYLHFTTREPKLDFYAEPVYHQLPLKGSATSSGIFKSNEPRALSISLTSTGSTAGGWSYSLLSSSLNLSPHELKVMPLVNIKNNSGKSPYWVKVFADVAGKTKKYAMVRAWAKEEEKPGEPGGPEYPGKVPTAGENPDENQQIINPLYPTPWIIDKDSKIGILVSGYFMGMGHLLGRFKISTVPVGSDLIVWGPEYSVDSLKVLIIPTGGLFGLDKNLPFKDGLKRFIENGGTVICLTQQQGYEFSCLPTPPIAYGWRQDNSCFANSSYLSDWHVCLSG